VELEQQVMSPTPTPCAAPARGAFTALELIVSISIMVVVVAMVIPTIYPALRKGQVHEAAEAIRRVCSQARQLAQTQSPGVGTRGAISYYGVAVVVPKTGPAYAVLTYGNTLPTFSGSGASTELAAGSITSPSGTRLSQVRIPFSGNVLPFTSSSPLVVRPGVPISVTPMAPGSCIGWYYQFRTGLPIAPASSGSVPITLASPGITIGVAGASAPGYPQALGVCTLDQRYVAALAVYKIGLINVQDL
jgi:type II secretory pathway pseudopilin PulG